MEADLEAEDLGEEDLEVADLAADFEVAVLEVLEGIVEADLEEDHSLVGQEE